MEIFSPHQKVLEDEVDGSVALGSFFLLFLKMGVMFAFFQHSGNSSSHCEPLKDTQEWPHSDVAQLLQHSWVMIQIARLVVTVPWVSIVGPGALCHLFFWGSRCAGSAPRGCLHFGNESGEKSFVFDNTSAPLFFELRLISSDANVAYHLLQILRLLGQRF